jgi:rhodanese-related sulfurtransferase
MGSGVGEGGSGGAGRAPARLASEGQPYILKSQALQKGLPVSFFIENWTLFAVAILSGGMLLWPTLSGTAGAGSVNASEAVQLINREKAAVVDVCGPDEFAAGHVGGARNVPLGELEAKLPGLVKNTATPVILVCASGMRSRRAVAIAKKLGYENAHSLTGGMGAWRAANLPVEKV